jgi:hypothetical protein
VGALAAKDLPNQPPPPRLELLRQLLEGGDRPVGSLALRREQRLEAGGRLVGPLPLGRQQRFKLLSGRGYSGSQGTDCTSTSLKDA